jgi:hypothetical protein
VTARERPYRPGGSTQGAGLRAALTELGEQARVYDALPGAVRRARRHRIRVRLAAAAAALAVLAAGITVVAWGHGALLSLPQPASSPTPTDLDAPGEVVPLPSAPAATPLKPGMRVGAAVLVTDRYLWTAKHRWYALPYSGLPGAVGDNQLALSWAALSPDGHQLVYGMGKRFYGDAAPTRDRLVVQDLSTGRTHSTAVTVRSVAGWSANSRWALLFTPGATPERPTGHREAIRLDLRTGATATVDLATLPAAVVDDELVPVVGAVRDDGRLLLVQAGPAPSFRASAAGSTADGAVTVRTVDPATGATVATTTLPGALPWRLSTIDSPGYTGPNPRPTPAGRLLVWLAAGERQLVVQVGPLYPSYSTGNGAEGWTATATGLFTLDSGRRVSDLPGLAPPDSLTTVSIVTGGHGNDLTVVLSTAYARELTVQQLDLATGHKRTTARYTSSFPGVLLPGQAAPLDSQ